MIKVDVKRKIMASSTSFIWIVGSADIVECI
jgi:hypothetical protein